MSQSSAPPGGLPRTDEESSSSYFSLSKCLFRELGSRAQISSYLSYIEIEIEDLAGLIEAYQKRTFVEDLDYLQQNLGGTLDFLNL
jgi:hypothetical protein